MEDIIKTLQDRDLEDKISARTTELNKKVLESELEIIKLKSGIETLQERIKMKDSIIEDLKDVYMGKKGGSKEVKENK